MSLQRKLLSAALFVPGFVLVIYSAFGPGLGAGTSSGDRLGQIGFALMFFGIALALIFRSLSRRKAR